MKKESWNKLTWITIFAIAMGFLETAVVVYVRKMYYPSGFNFPLHGFLEPSIINVELVREFATIIMLISIGVLASKKLSERLAYFLYAFAIWDIFYYIFLKIILNWPSSFFTWDILFLIPIPWIGPVLAPLLCTILMITVALLIINFEDKGIKVKFNKTEITLAVLGVILVLYTWLYDYAKMILSSGIDNNFIPIHYNWTIFIIGFILASIGIKLFYYRLKN